MILTVCAVTPLPLTVTVAVRWLVLVLAVAVTVIVPSLLPEAVETVSHDASLLTDHVVLEVIVKVCCPPTAAKFNEVAETVSDSVTGGT